MFDVASIRLWLERRDAVSRWFRDYVDGRFGIAAPTTAIRGVVIQELDDLDSMLGVESQEVYVASLRIPEPGTGKPPQIWSVIRASAAPGAEAGEPPSEIEILYSGAYYSAVLRVVGVRMKPGAPLVVAESGASIRASTPASTEALPPLRMPGEGAYAAPGVAQPEAPTEGAVAGFHQSGTPWHEIEALLLQYDQEYPLPQNMPDHIIAAHRVARRIWVENKLSVKRNFEAMGMQPPPQGVTTSAPLHPGIAPLKVPRFPATPAPSLPPLTEFVNRWSMSLDGERQQLVRFAFGTPLSSYIQLFKEAGGVSKAFEAILPQPLPSEIRGYFATESCKEPTARDLAKALIGAASAMKLLPPELAEYVSEQEAATRSDGKRDVLPVYGAGATGGNGGGFPPGAS